MKTLETYLRENLVRVVIDHAVRVNEQEGIVTFYVHTNGKDSDTLDFEVHGNMLIPSRFVMRQNDPDKCEPWAHRWEHITPGKARCVQCGVAVIGRANEDHDFYGAEASTPERKSK